MIVLVVAGGVLATHSRFTDVTDDHPVDAIEWAAEQGITKGYSATEFRPDEPLKRAHALIFLTRFYDNVLGANGDDQFANPDFTRADMMALLHSMVTPSQPTTTTTTTEAPGTGSLGVALAPEDCGGYDRDFYRPHGTSWRALGGVGYLTGQTLTSGDVDHVVALEEAWCSGIRDAQFGADSRNHRASVSSVNSGKGGRDPLEWWNTSGSTTPRNVDYPGWCDYLRLHVEVKRFAGGTMDQAEHDFIVGQLQTCDNQAAVTTTTRPRLSDSAVKQAIIAQSIASYSGSCACPYSRARDGSRCGARSAYSRPGGAQPVCYERDVTQEMIDRYRRNNP